MFGIEIIEHTYKLLLIFFNFDFSLFINHCSTLLVSTLNYFWKKLNFFLNSTVNDFNTFVDIRDQQPYIFLIEHYERVNTYLVEQLAKIHLFKTWTQAIHHFHLAVCMVRKLLCWPLDLPFFLARVTCINLWRIWLGVVLFNFTMKSILYRVINMAHFFYYGESIFCLWLGYSVKKQYLLLKKLDYRRTS